jgi:hypothetical protein
VGNNCLEKETKLTETPNAAPYDLNPLLTAVSIQNLIFVGRDVTELLTKLVNEPDTTIDVVMFPYLVSGDGEAQAAAKPRRGFYTGKLLGVLLNERKTKGRFTFEDGTVIYRDSAILE